MFQMWGIDGKAFTDGETAMAWIEDVDAGRYKGELPELALLDIRLPGSISGPMVGERLRRSPLLGEITIVLTTAYTMGRGEEIAVILRADADKLVYKPLPGFADFRAILESTLSERRARADAPNTMLPSDRIIRASTRTPVSVGRSGVRTVFTTGPRPAAPPPAPRPAAPPSSSAPPDAPAPPTAADTRPTPPLPGSPPRPEDKS